MKFDGPILTKNYFVDCFQSRLTAALTGVNEWSRLTSVATVRLGVRGDSLELFHSAPYYSYLAYPEVRSAMNKCLYKIRPTESIYIDKRIVIRNIKQLPANNIVLAFALKAYLDKRYPGLNNIYRIIQNVIEEKTDGIQSE